MKKITDIVHLETKIEGPMVPMAELVKIFGTIRNNASGLSMLRSLD